MHIFHLCFVKMQVYYRQINTNKYRNHEIPYMPGHKQCKTLTDETSQPQKFASWQRKVLLLLCLPSRLIVTQCVKLSTDFAAQTTVHLRHQQFNFFPFVFNLSSSWNRWCLQNTPVHSCSRDDLRLQPRPSSRCST